MSLKNELEYSGNWLFRYRSYLPILLFPFILYFLKNTQGFKLSQYLVAISITTSYIGQIIRIFTVAFIPPGTSGRNTKHQSAKQLNTSGIYSKVRHPLYLGNYFILLGPCILTNNYYLMIIYTLIFWIYYERIMFAEEVFLQKKFYNEFNEWSINVPAIIPNLKTYIPSHGRFSIIQVLEREYTGVCGILFLFLILILCSNIINNVAEYTSPIWIILFILNAIIYFSLRRIKKHRRKYFTKK